VDRPVELIPLVCIRCSTPIPAEPDEVAWVCAQCGQGMALNDEKGLASTEVQYATGIPLNGQGKPFWVVEGEAALQGRQTYSGNQDREAQKFWSRPRSFIIPAFTCSLETLLCLGTNYLIQPPDLQPGPPARFEPVTLYAEDVPAAAEFILVAIEAGRKDKLKEVNFSLKLTSPCLWILP
jgi:hypothetical protein